MLKILRILCYLSGIVALRILTPDLFAQAEEVKTVIVREGQGPRDIARETLGEPDLWGEILKANQLNSPSDLKPGMKLVIPSGAINRSRKEINNARQAIQMATDVGAKVFAGETITRAIARLDEAVQERGKAQWESSTRLAVEARQLAEQSHQESLEKRNTSADATVSDRSGTVQSKVASEMLWRDLSLYSKLYENNRVRTLSDSYAEISFQDQSRIRLNENSQAVIQKMRVDLLNKERDSSVKLEKGAAFALLQSNQKKKKFNLNIPGVKTEINSRNFWVQKEDEGTKIANYEGEIKVSSENTTVVIEENHGSQIAADGSIGKSKQLLRGTQLLAPKNNAILPGGIVQLQWDAVAQAQRYLLQVSADYSFKNIIINRDDIQAETFTTEALKDGAYYWTVAAIDKEGFPSPSSPRGFFYVFSDKDKPFLYVNHPQEQDIFQTDTLHIVGETEANVQLFIDGKPEALSNGSRFRFTHHLNQGINKISVVARDLGGNETTILRTVMYAADSKVMVDYDASMRQTSAKHFLAQGRTLDLKGSTVPLSSVSVQTLAGKAASRTFADAVGHFQLTLQDLPNSEALVLKVLTPTGYQKSDTIWVQVSKLAPQIVLSSKIPTVASEDTLRLEGSVLNAGRLLCNGADLKIKDGHFSHLFKLQPGRNVISLKAVDEAGNECLVQNEVNLDKTPPELVNYNVTTRSTVGDDIVDVKVKARDDSGLRRSAAIELLAGDQVTSGYVVYNQVSQTYEGSFKFPKGSLKAVKLKTLVLEDYYGNQAVLNPK
jgi:ferric-dicitrate binding protein FerR (iron transport regulator)